ncbi:MAG: LysE family translocator [Alphaproteobacteria bacterium]|nr:LysE family translocator [Alphaproteobacteria bacterium]
MHLWSLLVFTAVIGIGTATPGPTIIAVVARVLSRGRNGNLGFAIGIIAGDVVWLGAAVFGLAALAGAAHEAMVVLKYLGAAYLLYVAWKMWSAPATAPGDAAVALRGAASRGLWRGIAGGLAVALANPKTMMIYLALIPTIIEISDVGVAQYLGLAAIIIVVYSVVLFLYISAAHRARAMFRSPRALRLINRGSGTMMAGAAAVVATR